MSLKLQEHQQEAYDSVKRLHKENRFASVIFPTGCGKSFVALKLMEENPNKRILFLSPSHAIKNQMYNYIVRYLGNNEEQGDESRASESEVRKILPNFRCMLYQTLLSQKPSARKIIESLNPDIIIMDEVHHIKTIDDDEDKQENEKESNRWGQRVKELLDMYPQAKVLGLTATPERTDRVNVVERLFEGHIASEITLIEALESGRIAVKAPRYVTADYALSGELEGLLEQIEACEDESKKKKLLEKYDKLRKIVEEAEGVEELLKKNITKVDGKYIVFCKDRKDMEEKMKLVHQWFGKIDEEPEVYAVASSYDREKGRGYNERQIEAFEKSKSKHLKLLFSVDMLNEGLHVSDISGVIMTRKSGSRIVYLQQLGRALSSDPEREAPVVFDLVNNYVTYNLYNEAKEKRDKDKGKDIDIDTGTDIDGDDTGGEDRENGLEPFRIKGKAQEFLELLAQMKETLDENATAKLIRILTILKENGVDVTAIQKSKKVNGKKVSTIIKDIQQEGIDIETICKENGIELDYKIGQAISHTLKGAKGVRRTQVTPEQVKKLIEFGLITKE